MDDLHRIIMALHKKDCDTIRNYFKEGSSRLAINSLIFDDIMVCNIDKKHFILVITNDSVPLLALTEKEIQFS